MTPVEMDAFLFERTMRGLKLRPHISPNVAENEVSYYWKYNDYSALASVEGDGFVGYAYKVDGIYVMGKDMECPVTKFPDDLKEYLSKIPY
jgi:hypothetical protein